MKRGVLIFLFVAAMVLADQGTKHLAETSISSSESIGVLPFLSLVNVRNEGAAFGLFKALGNKFFIAVSLLAIGFMIGLLWRGRDSTFSLSLILAGATGNLIDRLLYGYVRDFIDVFIGRHHWPAFNVADSCLTVGILWLLISPAVKRPIGKKPMGKRKA
ncbi:MAG: signal peptidase II [Thermodesulfovibrionales bacterium]|nr:signal peptidase II [Thermodesulfovibrionales bacterium]